MKIKDSKGFSIAIAILALIAGNYLIFLIFPSAFQHENSSPVGLFIGAILIWWYQRTMLFNWVYKSRLILNAVALGIGCLLWTLPDLIITGFHRNPVQFILESTAIGFIFGLFLSLYDIIPYQKRKRKTPYTGSEKPILVSKATRFFSVDNLQYGRILLLHDRLLFLSAGEPNLEIQYSDIHRMEIGNIFTFQNKLILVFNDAESITFFLAMPGLWKKKITPAWIVSRGPIAINQ